MKLTEFVEYPVCPQCHLPRGPELKYPISYCPGNNVSAAYQRDRCPAGIQPEHLHITCAFCGYSWAAACVELPESWKPPEDTQPFEALTPCYKCGFVPSQMNKPGVVFCRGDDQCVQAMEHEYPIFHRSCVRCSYRWLELPLNQPLGIFPAE